MVKVGADNVMQEARDLRSKTKVTQLHGGVCIRQLRHLQPDNQ